MTVVVEVSVVVVRIQRFSFGNFTALSSYRPPLYTFQADFFSLKDNGLMVWISTCLESFLAYGKNMVLHWGGVLLGPGVGPMGCLGSDHKEKKKKGLFDEEGVRSSFCQFL